MALCTQHKQFAHGKTPLGERVPNWYYPRAPAQKDDEERVAACYCVNVCSVCFVEAMESVAAERLFAFCFCFKNVFVLS